MENKVVFKAQVGSYLHNTMLPNSDKDFKTFYYPTFDTLYQLNDQKSKSKVTDSEDNEWHDIRKLADLLINSNETYLGVLFSDNIESPERVTLLVQNLVHNRESIARMNLPKLIDSMMGMFNQHVKRYHRDLEQGETVKAGKSAAAALRIANVAYVYALSGFRDFASAIRFKDNDPIRLTILGIKAGEMDPEYIEHRLDDYKSLLEGVKGLYKANEPNVPVQEAVREMIKLHVRRHIAEELGGN